ncbi:SIR2 family protein [Rhodococcus qingshengii]|uniref:SIR2 family protein n=1 Tax=Rhodococcus qingshengii TaxID=334542 RepID=UPI0002B7D245|nr:SIR2 family protein [Rhodococcus qingshengii]EME14866.1 hypothetical protein G418_29502 [Rhodococcus qingshengii BKS 20-40]
MGATSQQVRNRFLREYVHAVENGSAAFFAGAGLSRDAGFVDWRGLLREFAEELGLDIEVESDLPLVAQYFIDSSTSQRARLNQKLRDEFDQSTGVTSAYRALSRLPIKSVWTTNYDRGVEEAYAAVGSIVDVKSSGNKASWTTVKPKSTLTVYKMHGDIGDPSNVVLSKDDYDRYARDHPYVLDALKSQLAEKTFLFSGFSFTDPNLDHVFAQVRANHGDNARTHWAVMKRAEGDREGIRQGLWIKTMHRYGLEVVLVDDYDDIPELLTEVQQRLRRRHVFVGGSALTAVPFGTPRLDNFCKSVGQLIIDEGFNLVSGFGLGIGSAVLAGAAESVYRGDIDPARRLRLFPFPQPPEGEPRDQPLDEQWRQSMMQSAGFAIFLSGNKKGPDGDPIDASGAVREYEIAVANGARPLPVGATGWVAKNLHAKVSDRFDELLPGASRTAFDELGRDDATNEELLTALRTLLSDMTP